MSHVTNTFATKRLPKLVVGLIRNYNTPKTIGSGQKYFSNYTNMQAFLRRSAVQCKLWERRRSLWELGLCSWEFQRGPLYCCNSQWGPHLDSDTPQQNRASIVSASWVISGSLWELGLCSWEFLRASVRTLLEPSGIQQHTTKCHMWNTLTYTVTDLP